MLGDWKHNLFFSYIHIFLLILFSYLMFIWDKTLNPYFFSRFENLAQLNLRDQDKRILNKMWGVRWTDYHGVAVMVWLTAFLCPGWFESYNRIYWCAQDVLRECCFQRIYSQWLQSFCCSASWVSTSNNENAWLN